ncbi:MAG: hypothetical protein COA62_10320 [Rhodobiaceae bacterium]|nr:MAG: hypothetical protein COA62_10320 [Rhodobiaceae bacterium]
MTSLHALILRFFGDDPLRSRLFSKGVADFGVKSTGFLALFAMNAVLARLMGLEAFGHFAFVSSALVVFAMMARQGMDSVVLRLVPGYVLKEEWGLLRGLLRWTFKRVFAGAVGLGLAIAVGLIVLRDTLPAGLFATAMWGAVILPILALSQQIQYVLRSRAWVVRAQIPDLVLRPLGVMAIVGVVWFCGFAIYGRDVMAITVAVSLVGLAMGAVWLRKSFPAPAHHAPLVFLAPEWRKVSTQLLFAAGANLLLMQIDILMLGIFQSTDQSGLYAIASRISAMAIFATVALASFGAPLVAELYSQKKMDDLASISKTMARVAFALLVPAVIVLVLFGKDILGLFGQVFVTAYYPLLILVGGQVLATCFGVSVTILTMTAHEKIAARVLVLSVVANIVLNAALIPLYGMVGAAVATALTLAFPVVRMSFIVRSRLGIDTTIF